MILRIRLGVEFDVAFEKDFPRGWSGRRDEGRSALRAPRRKRPLHRHVVRPGPDVNLAEIAERVVYVGSPEHKDTPSFVGLAKPRADASICDKEISDDRKLVAEWLRRAIMRGAVGGMWEGDFPRYAWHKEGDLVYEARLVNRELGQYKGYPLNETDWPEGLDSIYE